MNFILLFTIGLGGFLGAILRFSISSGVQKLSGSTFPFGTLSVNILGSFIIGFLFLYFQQTNLSPTQKAFFITGLLGALTTFSTFSLDTVLLIQNQLYIKAISSVTLNLFLSVLGTILGMFLYRKMYF